MSSTFGLLTVWAALNAPPAEPAQRVPLVETYALLGLGAQMDASPSFSPDGRALLTTSQRGAVLWEIASGRPRAALESRDFPGLVGARFLPGGRTVLLQRSLTVTAEVSVPVTREGADGKAVTVTERGIRRVSEDTAYQIYALPGVRPGPRVPLERFPAHVTVASRSGRLIAAFCKDERLRIWSLTSGKELLNVRIRRSPIPYSERSIRGAFSADDRYFAFTLLSHGQGLRGKVLLYDLQSRTLRPVAEVGANWAWAALAFSEDGRHLVAAEDSRWGGIQVLSLSSGRQRVVRAGFGGGSVMYVSHVSPSISPDGSIVVPGRCSLGGDPLEVWDVRKGKPICRLRLPANSGLSHIALAGDLSFVAAVFARRGMEDTVALWRLPPAVRADSRSTPGRQPQSPDREAAPAPERLWTRLASEDPADAYRASWSLREQPRAAVALLHSHLRPAAALPAGSIKARIAQLDDDSFRVRQAALRALQRMDSCAAPELRAALRGGPSLEVRRRVELLLAQIDGPIRSRDLLREIRAVEVLEQIGTPTAQDVLRKLARGAPEARLTREAKASLGRMSRSNAAARAE